MCEACQRGACERNRSFIRVFSLPFLPARIRLPHEKGAIAGRGAEIRREPCLIALGNLWEYRFNSVILDDGAAARTMTAYSDLKPVRAGMVKDPANCRWSGYCEAVGAGKKLLHPVAAEFGKLAKSSAGIKGDDPVISDLHLPAGDDQQGLRITCSIVPSSVDDEEPEFATAVRSG
jgi:hypothetical protein